MDTEAEIMMVSYSQLKSIYIKMALAFFEYEITLINQTNNIDKKAEDIILKAVDECRKESADILNTLPTNFLELLQLTQNAMLSTKNVGYDVIHDDLMKRWQMVMDV